jgi:hypothetical protein
MSVQPHEDPPRQGGDLNNWDKPVWGALAIGEIIGRSERQTHHLLSRGSIKSAKRIGGRWCATPSALRREFGG